MHSELLMKSPACLALVALALGTFVLGCGEKGTYLCVQYEAQVGEACSVDMPCADDLSCIDAVCQAHGSHGDACSADLACLEPYVCDAGTCVGPRRPANTPCLPGTIDACVEGTACMRDELAPYCRRPVGEGEECVADGQCPEGLACVSSDGARSGRCGEAPGLDEECTPSRGCALGLLCVDIASTQTRCVFPPLREMDACAVDADCPAAMHCVEASATGAASCLADLAEGDACSARRTGVAQCADGLFCNGSTSVCEHVGGEGEPCHPASEACEDGLFCQPAIEGGTLFCLPSVAAGASCREGQACGAGAYCDEDRAGPRLSPSWTSTI